MQEPVTEIAEPTEEDRAALLKGIAEEVDRILKQTGGGDVLVLDDVSLDSFARMARGVEGAFAEFNAGMIELTRRMEMHVPLPPSPKLLVSPELATRLERVWRMGERPFETSSPALLEILKRDLVIDPGELSPAGEIRRLGTRGMSVAEALAKAATLGPVITDERPDVPSIAPRNANRAERRADAKREKARRKGQQRQRKNQRRR